MPLNRLSRMLLLPELVLEKVCNDEDAPHVLYARKDSKMEVCPKCATPSRTIYDTRSARIRDAPFRGRMVALVIRKRRFWCKCCEKPFTEPVAGVSKGHRTTERLKREVLSACENFSDLKRVRDYFRCSASFVYRMFYEQLERKRRTRLYPWPSTIGIDEHSFKRNKTYGHSEFASIVVDYKNRRVMEVIEGKDVAKLKVALAHIKQRENVSRVVMDLSPTFRSFAESFFPKAKIVADKFHVIRLLHPHINRMRKAITGDKRKNPVRKLLLKSGVKLDYRTKRVLELWLQGYPELEEVYRFKEAIHQFYRIKGLGRARKALNLITDRMAYSLLPEIQRLRKTLMDWREEILEYFATGLTNGRTEGFNNKIKVVKRKAYGYRSFRNYRLRVLNCCS